MLATKAEETDQIEEALQAVSAATPVMNDASRNDNPPVIIHAEQPQ